MNTTSAIDERDDATTTRRGFLQASAGAGAAMLLAFYLPMGKALAAADADFRPNVYIRIARDGKVSFIVPFTEMGQGTFTAVPMMLAEEIDVDLSTVSVEQAPADEKAYAHPLFGVQITGGSASIVAAWKAVRVAGATCRAMLVEAAADTWKVKPEDCTTRKGEVVHGASGRRLSYGALAARAAARPVPAHVAPKDPARYTLVGTPARRLDTRAKVDGSAVFGIDVRPRGVKVAAVANSPVFGGTVRRVDDAKARAVKGVRQVVLADSIVAVVADHYGAAKKGLAALAIQWDEGANAEFSSSAWLETIKSDMKKTGVVATKEGDFAQARAGAAQSFDAQYEAPPLAHATMEPLNCTLHVRPDGCEVWLGTQAPARAQGLVANVLGVPPQNVLVHNHLIGGGFGRKLDADYVEQAAKIAKQVDGPVKVIWSREEDLQHDTYRPYYYDELSAALDTSGRVVAFSHRIGGSSIVARYAPQWLSAGAADPDAVAAAAGPYSTPVKYVEYVRSEPPAGLITGWWRGVGPTHNCFVNEGFMDELAARAKADPVAFRRAHLDKSPRARAVLDLAAEKSDWGRKLPPGTGRGVALLNAWSSYVALVVELSVGADGTVKVHRMTSAVDCGTVINPDIVLAQMQGGHIFGLTAVMYSALTFERGRVQQSNFHDYPVLRMSESPAIDVHIVAGTGDPGGMGEIGTAVVAPAFVNAIHAATGKRFRTYPIRAEALKA
jgi:isoquinoline 1-oxidoreductase beta subunit